MARYTRKPVDLMALLQQNPVMQGQQQADLVRQLNTELQQILQLEKLSFCKVNVIRQGRVQILCTTAGWATRLRLNQAELLSAFRRHVPECGGIDIEVNPNVQLHYQQATEPTSTPQVRQISDQAAHYLEAAAQHADPVLAEKLRKLAALSKASK
ncbi:MAG TPA: DUF721 domain-containing protein [Rheinheimera sp.]|nr:DUF721 domain-containing protein [Rheinheimera sp.]